MLSVEEYIAKRKKKDNLNEFDFKLHSENMSTVIQYVMDYFNNYVNSSKRGHMLRTNGALSPF